MKKFISNFVIKKINDLVNKIYVRLFLLEIFFEIVENGLLVFYRNGNVFLNYNDE